jgi:hypothetical protein
MDLRHQKKLRDDYLVELWKMHKGYYGADVDNRAVCKGIGIDYDKDGTLIAQPLRAAGSITWASFDRVALTDKGIPEAERIVEERYSQEEVRVLRKIYDMSEQNTAKPVFLHQLETELGMGWQQVTGFCKGLNEQDLIEWPPDVEAYLFITRRGIEAINSLGKPKRASGGDTYNTNIGTVQGGAHVGPGVLGTSKSISLTILNSTRLLPACFNWLTHRGCRMTTSRS